MLKTKRKKRKLSPRGKYTIGEWLEFHCWAPIMTYDRPKTDEQVETIKRLLAPHNMTASAGERYIHVEPLDWDGILDLHWLSIADEIVIDNGGGCEG